MHIATWETKTVANLIELMGNNDYVLPGIQRRLVWDEDKMALLFDTIFFGNSFGAIIAVQESQGDKALFATRPFTLTGERLDSTGLGDKLVRSRWLVIDGQQRLQSLLMGLKGSINGKQLYLDIAGNGGFLFESESKKLPVSLKDDNQSAPLSENHPCIWVKASDLFAWCKQYSEPSKVFAELENAKLEHLHECKDSVVDNITKFKTAFFGDLNVGISVVKLPSSDPQKSRQMIVELFRRLNDGGTRLSASDLVASIFKGYDSGMESFLEETVFKYSKMGLSQDNLLKLLFILEDKPLKEMTDITEMDAKFALDNRKKIENTLKAISEFMRKTNLVVFYEKYHPSFIPIYFLAYHVFHSPNDNKAVFFDRADTSSPDFVPMWIWIFHSFLNDVFRSKGAGWIPYRTGIRKMHACMQSHKGQAFPTEALFDIYRNHPLPNFSTDYSIERLPTLNASFLYFLIYGDTLAARINDVDHIMPKSILEGLQFDARKVNSICNYQLLDYETNRGGKNAKPFKEWLTKQVANKEVYLAMHLIPQDETLWDEQNFESFYAERGKLLLDRIASKLPRTS